MGFRQYLDRSGDGARFKWSAIWAVLFHGFLFAVGGIGLAGSVEYGMAGAVAGGGQPRTAPPREASVDLEDFSDEAPMETSQKPKPVPTPVAPTGAGGALSSGAQEMPAYYLNPPPPYPEEARHLKQEGLVTIHVEVDAEGKVSSDSLAQSSGFPLLDDSALQTVRGWRFKPARIAGIAVSKGVDIPVRFRLKDARW